MSFDINNIMNVQKILESKAHNSHYLNRYVKFILSCQQNISTENIEEHHICPKAKDMFPEYRDGKKFPWNIVKLTYRQHLIAHRMLWKAYGGSQTYAFVGMNQQKSKRGNIQLKSSRAYARAKEESNALLKKQNKGFAIYIDKDNNKVRCQTDDLRVKSGELISTSKGRKFQKRSQESRDRTRAAVTGKNTRRKTIEERLARRVYKDQNILFFNPDDKSFIEMDPIFANTNLIKVFTCGKQVWNSDGKYRRVDINIPIAPPGWSFINSKIIFKIINLENNEYQECTGDFLPLRYHKLSLCKNGKKLLYCTTLNKEIYLDQETINKFGVPVNCISNQPLL